MAGITSKLNGAKGGRPKAARTVEAEKAKDYIAQRVGEYMPQLFDVMITKALKGDVQHLREIFDRAWGRPTQAIAGDKDNPLIVQLSEYITKKHDIT